MTPAASGCVVSEPERDRVATRPGAEPCPSKPIRSASYAYERTPTDVKSVGVHYVGVSDCRYTTKSTTISANSRSPITLSTTRRVP